MSTYLVWFTTTMSYGIEVEADDRMQAEEIATEKSESTRNEIVHGIQFNEAIVNDEQVAINEWEIDDVEVIS